jgi:hypothetical protein
MKTNVLLVGLFLFTALITVHAQNKTLGVGATVLNPNAVLHVESPTANQGFLMPRLTTAQRTASGFQGNLTNADIGLMVFDTDLKEVYTWQGSAWESGSEIPLPYVDTVLSAPNGSNLLRLVYAGSATENVGVAQFENLNPNNGFSALFARSNSITNGAADFVVNNAANTNDAVGVTTNGLGHAGSFAVTNASNANAAIYATTNGTGSTLNSAAIYGETITAFSAITAVVPASAATSNAISGVTKSTDSGSWAGYFDATTGTAVYGTTKSNVGGALAPVGVYGESTGTGSVGGAFWIRNASNNYPALYSNTIGIGSSLSVNVNNAANSAPAAYVTTNGTGAGIQAETSTGFTSFYARRNGATNGNAGLFDITDAANTYPSLQANTVGTGAAGNFRINNSSSTSPAVFGLTNGNGPAFSGDNTGNGDIFAATKTGATGSAGNFQVNNASNTGSALFAMTNAQNGFGLGVSNSGNGNAISIFTGGVKVSTATITSASITARAAAYRITSGGTTFTFGFPFTDGEVYMVFNDTGSAITVQGVAIPTGEGRTIVNFAGTFRGF